MVDTIRLGMTMPLPSPADLRRARFTAKNGVYYRNITHQDTDAIPEGCTVALHASNLYDHYFGVTVSASKLIHGNNVEAITETDLAFLPDSLSDIVDRHTGIAFDANRADIATIHFDHNWQLENESAVYAYRDQLIGRSYPYKLRKLCAKEHGTDTVYFANQSEAVAFYGKHAETMKLVRRGEATQETLAKSIGMLRWEHRLLKPAKIAEFAERFGCSRRAGSFLRYAMEMTREALSDDMKILGLDTEIEVTGKRDRADKVKRYCGSNTVKLQALLGFLYSCDIYGIDNLVALGMINAKTLGNRRRELANAGIALTCGASRLLPPLPLPDFVAGAVDDIPFNKTKLCSPQGSIDAVTVSPYAY